MGKQFSLGKSERLKSRKLTELLFKEGKKISQGNLRIYYLILEDPTPGLLFGVGVSTKLFKKATERNRIRRLIRESYRLQKNPLKEQTISQKKQLLIFFVFNGKEMPAYKEVFENTTKAITRLIKLTTN